MSARNTAAFCLLNLVLLAAPGFPQDQPDTQLLVYLGAGAGSERALGYMRLESTRVMQAAGYRIAWADAGQTGRPSTNATLIVVRFSGECAISHGNLAGGEAPVSGSPLASTAVSDGRIIPFVSIDCNSLTRLVSDALASEPPARRDFLYGRAMGRLLSHELYHVLLQTGNHAREGIAQPGFSPTDLLTERFEFESSTLAKLRPGRAAGPADSDSEASGRQ